MPRRFETLSDFLSAIAKASFAASLSGAIALTAVSVISWLDHSESMSLRSVGEAAVAIPVGVTFLTIVSLMFTVPTTVAVATGVYPLALKLNGASMPLLAFCGFAIGCAEWLAMFPAGPSSSGLASWPAVIFVGGLAGCAGGISFASHLKHRLSGPPPP